jgi:ABC-type sulfate/molybdate transport systems ATPase subunit
VACTGGSFELNGTIAYVPQEAWIINATMRDNILFGQPYDEKRYNEVCQMAALIPDFKILTAGDLTEIGGRGVNLSGGQRQRVSIARALYSERDVAIFDDPFSAVDAHVAAHLVENAIAKYIRSHGKTGIIVTNQLQFLSVADRIVLMKDGKIAEQGTFAELKANGKAFADLIEVGIIGEANKTQEEATVKDEEAPEDVPKKKKKKNFAAAEGEVKADEARDKDKEEADLKKGNLTGNEEKEVGNIGITIYWYYIVAGSVALFLLGLLVLAIVVTTRVYYSIWVRVAVFYYYALFKIPLIALPCCLLFTVVGLGFSGSCH